LEAVTADRKAKRSDPLAEIAALLRPYDPLNLLAAVAGLQLLPENASQTLRLEALGHVAASLKFEPNKPSITESKLRTILNASGFSASILPLEDPIQTPFTEAVSFISGSFLVLPGLDKEITFVLRSLLKSLFLHKVPLPREFLDFARSTCAAVLTLSDTIAKRVGLRRGTAARSIHRGPVTIPDRQEMVRLAQAAVFRDDELDVLFARFGGSATDLNELTIELGSLEASSYDPERAPLISRPIVAHGGLRIVAAPSELASALVNRIVVAALQQGIGTQLAERYRDAVWHGVRESLRLTHNRRIPSTILGASPMALSKWDLFSLDSDKAICALFISDSLDGLDGTGPDTRWPGASLSGLGELLGDLERRLREPDPSPSEVLFLIVLQHLGTGTHFAVPFPRVSKDSGLLILTASELQTVTECEIGDPLALWKFARAAQRAHESRDIMTMSMLDDYNIYRHCHHSYYTSDDRIDLLATIPDEGGRLRQELAESQDSHSVPSEDGRHVTEVRTVYDTATIPIYIPRTGFGHGIRFLVEGLPSPVWIVSSSGAPNDDAAPIDVTIQVGEAIAYWLWQFTPSIRRPLQPLANHRRPISIRLNWLGKPGDWRATLLRELTAVAPSFCQSTADPEEGTLTLSFSPSLEIALMGQDNSGERELLRRVLVGLRMLLTDADRALWTESEIYEAIEKHAPLGLKKKIFTLNVANNPELCPLDSPSFRPVQEADEHELLDEVGAHLRGSGWKGQITGTHRTEVLNSAVEYCFQRMVQQVKELSADGLLEFLVAHHEATTLAEARHRLTIPTRLACFKGEQAILTEISKQQQSLNKAAVAGRFLIEYVTSSPPSGRKQISLAVYDRLQSLAAAIFDFGFASDLVHWGLADAKISVLGSGRLGYVSEEFQRARDAFLPALSSYEVVQATENFVRYWEEPGRRRPHESADPLQRRIEAASKDEFGAPLSDLVSVMAASTVIRLRADQPFVCLSEDDLTSELAAGLQWDGARARQCIRILALEPRADFLNPPLPFSQHDVFPWIFNRGLSYLRRPFLTRDEAGVRQVIYGIRHMEIASRTLLAIVFGGRLRARTPIMQKLMGTIADRAGDAFNNRVADLLEEQSKLVVKRKLKKVGKLKLPGDVDVLVASPAQRVLTLIECKDLAVCRTPREFKNQINDLFNQEDGFLKRHREREMWITNHLTHVLQFLNFTGSGKWRVRSLIVLSEPLIASYLRRGPVPIVTFEDLRSLKWS